MFPSSLTTSLLVLVAAFQPIAVVLAAPQTTATVSSAAAAAANVTADAVVADAALVEAFDVELAARSLNPSSSCYSGGQTFSALGSSASVHTIVKNACSYFNFYNNHKFATGGTVQWCYNVPFGNQGLSNNVVLMMKYKGAAASFTPLSSNYVGGLQEYCYTAMQWALDNCNHGGYFTNHKVGTSAGYHYWDVKLDPNSGSCAQN